MSFYKRLCMLIQVIIIAVLTACTQNQETASQKDPAEEGPVRISTACPRYFETDRGEAWIPISTNFLPADGLGGTDDTDEFRFIENYFKNFSANGGNSLRIWISTSFLEIEDEEEGKYNPDKFKRIDKLLGLAEKYNLLIKFTLQHIRTVSQVSEPSKEWANSKALASRFNDINEYVNTPEGRRSYLSRARALGERYRNNKQIYAWELWNEMNAVTWDDWEDFTYQMLDSVKAIFPNHLVTQTLGSLDCPKAEETYKKMFPFSNNEFVSLHRYLDPGDEWGQYAQVKGSIDTLVSTLMDFAKTYIKDRPIVYNEVGAVEGSHAGPSKLYPLDKEGVLIHDMVFAPFFCGAAGCGVMWHWDHYILKNELWRHFKSFARAVEGLDPVKERFESFAFEWDGVRCYGLKGQTKTVIWCRDTANNWKTELEQHIPAEEKTGWLLDLDKNVGAHYASVRFYNPWEDAFTVSEPVRNPIAVPPFKRSVVIILQ